MRRTEGAGRAAARPAILCVGGLDPSGSAGLLADAEAVWKAGGRPLAVATAWTVQTRRGVRAVRALSKGLVLAQLDALLEDEEPAAIKLGMLGRGELAAALAIYLGRRLGTRALVVDPVLRASSGHPLFRGDLEAYHRLFALATVVTPNLPEAAALLHWKGDVAWNRSTMLRAARGIRAFGAGAVVLKGGHLGGERADDLLLDRTGERWFGAPRLALEGRGTGCRFASALATRLARGEALPDAVAFAKKLVRRNLIAQEAGD